MKGLGSRIKDKVKDKFGRKDKSGKDKDTKDAKDGTDPATMTPAQKEQLASDAAMDTYHQISAHRGLRSVPSVLASSYAKWQPKGVKGIWLEPAGGTKFTVNVKVNPTHPSPSAEWATPHASNVSHKMSFGQVRAGNETWATGAFAVDDTSGLLFGPSKSQPRAAARKEATVQARSHAEETVAARFLKYWNDLLAQKKSKQPIESAPDPVNVRLELHVGCSCCVNCAHYVAGFVKNLRSQGVNVSALVKFASLYMGGQMTGERANPTTVPKSTIDANKDLFAEFLGKGYLEQGGAVRETDAPGRYWGTPEEIKARQDQNPGEEWYTIQRNKKQGELALAILRSADITVEVLEEGDIAGKLDQAQKDELETARELLDSAIERVNEWIKSQKVGSKE